MRKFTLPLYSFLLLLPATAAAQFFNPSPKPKHWTVGLMVSGGLAGTALNTTDFDLWALANGGHPGNRVEGVAHVGVFLNKYDFGVQSVINSHNTFNNFFVGRQLYHKNRFYSFLELSAGDLRSVYKNAVPPQYAPTPDEDGRDMYMRSKPFLLGLTSRNILTYINRKGYDAAHIEFFGTINYIPGNQVWKYGYDVKKEDDSFDPDTGVTTTSTYNEFHGRRVPGIPVFGRFMFTAGITVGLGGPVVSSNPRFAGRQGRW